MFWFVLAGALSLRLRSEGRERTEDLAAGDAVALPAGVGHGVVTWTSDVELLEVTLPAQSMPVEVVDARR
jgi:mannose-6-phosphate isomerase-like protein (cupin superfamily)